MRRWLFTILAGLSAVVFVVAAGARARMLFAWDSQDYRWWDEGHQQINSYSLTWFRGNCSFMRWRMTPIPGPDSTETRRAANSSHFGWHHNSLHPLPLDDALWPWISGTHVMRAIPVRARNGTRSLEIWQVDIRLWPVILLSAVLPLLWTRAFLRERRRKRVGLCPACGYDLRESPERCPECGEENAIANIAKGQRSQRTAQGSEG